MRALLAVLLLAGCSGAPPQAQIEPTQPAKSSDAPSAPAFGPWELAWSDEGAWLAAYGMDPRWQPHVEAIEATLTACFRDYTAAIDSCRGELAATKVRTTISFRDELVHGPALDGGHAMVFVSNNWSSATDACMQDDYENSRAFDNCVERSVGERIAAAWDTSEPVTIQFSNVEPTEGSIGLQ